MSKNNRNITIIVSILLYFVLRCFIISNGGGISAAYFFSSFNIIALFYFGVPVGTVEIVSKYVRERYSTNQYINAKRVLYFGLISAVLYSLVAIGLIFAMSNADNLFLAGINSVFSLRLLAPSVMFVSISAVFKGYFMGAKKKTLLNICFLSDFALALVGTIIFSKVFEDYGNKVVKVLYDNNVISGFFSGGVCIGITLGLMLGMIIHIVIYFVWGRTIEDGIIKHVDDIYDLGNRMIADIFKFGCFNISYSLFIFALQVKFFDFKFESSFSEAFYESLNNYRFSLFFGIVLSVISLPVLFARFYAYLDIRPIRIGYNSGDRQQIRSKVNDMLRKCFIYTVPLCVYILVMAGSISGSLFGGVSSEAVRCIRFVSVFPILLCAGYILNSVLVGIKKINNSILSGVAALVLGFLVMFIPAFKENNLIGAICALYVFGLTYFALGLLFVIKYLKFNPDILICLVRPCICGAIIAVISILLNLLFSLFAPLPVRLIVIGIIDFVVAFIVYLKLGAFNASQLKRSPIGIILYPIASLFSKRF